MKVDCPHPGMEDEGFGSNKSCRSAETLRVSNLSGFNLCAVVTINGRF